MKKIWCMLVVLISVLCCSGTVYATNRDSDIISDREREEQNEIMQKQTEETIFHELEFDSIDAFLNEIFPNERVRFRDVLQQIISGDIESSLHLAKRFFSDYFFYEWKKSKTNIIHILFLVLVASVFSNFSSVFQNKQVSEISFYVLYLLLLTVSLQSFRVLVDSVELNVQHLTTFMKVLGPIYFLALAFASGSTTSIAFYNLVLLLIYLVELLVLNFVLPCVQVSMIVKMMNHLSDEDYLSKFAELLETLIVWILKTLLAGVIGLNLIQGLINPAIDALKRNVWSKGVEAVPIIKNVVGGTAEVMLGTAVLIKNGIGVAGAIICIVICMTPMIQMAVVTLLYKLVAAMIQPISDKRITANVSSVAEGAQLLLRIVFTVGVLFLLTIAIVTATTT